MKTGIIILFDLSHHKLPEIINDWIHGKDLHSTFLINRQLWKEQLSLQGFWMRELRRYFN